MKILQLRFKNLNSLYGEWSIDFADPAYLSSGIFAITGPTGSGKSTVLDAISLALFGQTPRLKKVVKSTNEIMSRKTAECFAEVIFESQKGRFKCHWSQTRAKKSPTGNLQEPAHEISNDATGEIIENKKSLVGGVIEQMTGMDFQQFTRSILLAQGSFAAFLQTSSNDRAEILEQITGTDAFSRISTRVFERQRDENARLDNLNAEISGIKVLLPDEEELVKSELAAFQKEETEITERHAADTRALQWLTGIETLQSEIVAIAAAAAANERLLVAFKPERDRLELAGKAAELAADYTALTITRQQQQTDKDALTEVEKVLPALEKAGIEHEKQLHVAEKQTAGFKAQQNEQKPLWQKVRAIDVKLAAQGQAVEGDERECQKLEAQQQANVAQQKKLAAEQKKTGVELESIAGFLKTNARDEALVTQYAALQQLAGTLQPLADELEKREQELEKEKKQVKKTTKDQKARAAELTELQKQHVAAEKALKDQETALNKLLAGKLLREYQTERDTLLKEAGFIKRIAGFAADRKKLEDGKPCPLCGATEHPFAVGNIPELDDNQKRTAALDVLINQAEAIEAQIKTLKEDEHDLAKKLLLAESKLTQAAQAVETSATAVQEKTNLVVETEKRHNTARDTIFSRLHGFGFDEIPDNDLAALMSVLHARLQAWQETQTRKAEVENRVQQLAADLKGLQGIASTLDTTLAARKASLVGLLATLQQLQNERSGLFGSRNPDEEEQTLDRQIAEAEKAVQKAKLALDKAKISLNESKTLSKNLNEKISGRNTELAGLEKGFLLNLGRKGFADEAAFMCCRMSEAQRKALTQQAQELDKKVADTLTRLRDSEAKLDHERQLNLTAVSRAELQNSVTEQAARIKNLVEAIGGLKQKLAENRRALELLSNRKAEIDRQTKECRKWDLLNNLIGSRDGQKYSRFAQGLTFGIIVTLANQQLEKMTGRYLLTRDPHDLLELKIIDKYQAGEVRSTKNLSGGESFIVSLALALGLSKLASKKVRVDSLFLDEGFGTLDDDALQIALDTLAGLQQDGKLIGVISHVAMLKERIGTQITVTGSNTGRSTISGPGIKRV